MPSQSTHILPVSAAEALGTLDAEATHKAALKMYYAAARVFREYHGPFAPETSAQREERAKEFEELGHTAEQDRREHGAHFQTPARWRCPSCHVDFPEKLAVCGSCGFDLRTGKPFVRSAPKPTASGWGAGYTTVPAIKHPIAKKHRRDNSVMMLLALLIGIAFFVAVLALTHNLLSPIEKMPANHPTTQRP